MEKRRNEEKEKGRNGEQEKRRNREMINGILHPVCWFMDRNVVLW